jgi:Trypsin-co-occurring domain 1
MPIIESKETVDGQQVSIFIEVDEPTVKKGPYDDTRGATDKIITGINDALGDGLNLTRKCAARAVETIKAMDEALRPQEFSVQLAIKLDSEVGAVIAKASAGAQLQVTMKWVKKD